MNGFIYKITNTVNGMVYIGQTVSKVLTRWASHKANARNNKNPFRITRAIQKYSEEAFIVETLVEVPSEMLDAAEVAFISVCYSNDPQYGYNINKGGSGFSEWKSERIKKAMVGRVPWNKGLKGQVAWNKGIEWSEEVKQKFRGPRAPMTEEQRAKRRKVYTPEQIAVKEAKRIKRREDATRSRSEKMSGVNNPFYGKTHSEESLRKMSEANLGRESWNKGIPPSEETRTKISETLMGNTPWNLGVPATEEHKRKSSESHMGLVQSAETIAKRSESLRGQTRTPEQKARMSAAKLGKKNSNEHVESMSKAVKALWADPGYRERMLQSRRDKAVLRKAA